MVTQTEETELRAELRKKPTIQLRFLIAVDNGPQVVKLAKEILFERGKLSP